jgi:hypothetical protein
MTFPQLLEAQWSDYPERHTHRTNLLIHILAVPMSWFGAFWILGGFLLMLMGVPGAFGMLFWGAAFIAGALAAQHYGNSLEGRRAPPIRDPKQFARHAFAEQFVTFPRFVLTGAWFENLKQSL